MDQDNGTRQSVLPAKAVNELIKTAHLQQDERQFARNLGADRRTLPRVQDPEQAALEISLDRHIEGELYNLSACGCSIRLTCGTLYRGDEVWFKIDAVKPWKGTFRWASATNVGV